MGNARSSARARRAAPRPPIVPQAPPAAQAPPATQAPLAVPLVPQAVGDKQDLERYALSEWRGDTAMAKTILRALQKGLRPPDGRRTLDRLTAEMRRGASWLKDFSFGRRIKFPAEEVVSGFRECLDALDKLHCSLPKADPERESALQRRLNSDPRLDALVCEAVKLHMLSEALQLHKAQVDGAAVPLFAMILFARQTSLSPKEFMINHLNPVGDSAGLEQIEMFLLGHTLRATLVVVRPSCFGGEDFLCHFPDDNVGSWPDLQLIAEDDRHYNALAP